MSQPKSETSDRNVLIVNPLPRALNHYVHALGSCIEGVSTTIVSVDIEGFTGWRRVSRALAILGSRFRRWPAHDAVHLVAWPSFGYFEPATWLWRARTSQIHLVIHDVRPLRRQFGYSWFARLVFRLVLRSRMFHVICHTQEAASELLALTGVRSKVLPLPLSKASPTFESVEPTVRVMGQFKDARTLVPMEEIARGALGSEVSLHVHGRGWPSVVGWANDDRFVPEEEFASLIGTASIVLIPYSHFYQSDIANRCIEMGTPIVGPDHPHLRQLFGANWPGLVKHGSWVEATRRVLSLDRDYVKQRFEVVETQARNAWTQWAIMVGETIRS